MEFVWEPLRLGGLENVDDDDDGEEEEEGDEADVDGHGADQGEPEHVQREQEEHHDQVEDGKPPSNKEKASIMFYEN